MFDHIVGAVGVLFGIAGFIFGIWEHNKRRNKEIMVFGFLRGVKVAAVGNSNNPGDTSPNWNALVTQIDDINRRIER